MKIRYLFPNIITTCSLALSLTALHQITLEQYITASWLILLAILCDGLDGKLARALRASSSFGAEYDSLVDFVSFGVVPGYLFYRIGLENLGIPGAITAFFYVVCGGYRLVRYNLNDPGDGKKHSFSGLPIPAAAGFISSMTLFEQHFESFRFPHGYLLVILPVIGILMISRIEFLSIGALKWKKLYADIRFYVMLLLLIAGVFYPYLMYMVVMGLYIVYCLARHILIKVLRKRTHKGR